MKVKVMLGLTSLVAITGLQQLKLNRTYANVSVSNKNDVEITHLNKKDEKTNVQYIDYENGDSFNKDVEKLFQKVKTFLEGAANVPEANFDDYCREFIKNDSNNTGGKIKSINIQELYDIFNQGTHMLLYRGISSKESANQQKQGIVYIGGPVRGTYYPCNASQSGNGIYLTTSLHHANGWSMGGECIKEFSKSDLEAMNSAEDMTKFIEENKSQYFSESAGENLMFLLPKDSKLVSNEYLNKIFDKMLEIYPDYFKSFIDFKNNNLLPLLLVGSSYFKVLNEFFKEQVGFDYFNCGLSAEERANKFNELSHKFIYFNEENLNNTEKFQLYKKFQIWSLNHVDEQKNSYLVDKVLMLSQNFGLLAKLMGYDGVYENRGAPGKVKENGEQFCIDEVVVVNYNNLLVCNEGLPHMPQTIVL